MARLSEKIVRGEKGRGYQSYSESESRFSLTDCQRESVTGEGGLGLIFNLFPL